LSAFVDCIHDPAIPALPAVLNPVELGEQLRELLPLQTKGVHHLQVQVLRYHPGKRCVVAVTVPTTEGTLNLIGKVYATDRKDVYQLMEEVERAGFGHHDEFSIPRPTAYLPTLQLLLQERVDGQPATESFLSDQESECTAVAERCARWLAQFHAMAPRMGTTFHLSDYLSSIERWSRRLGALGEPFASKAGALFKGLEAAASKLQPMDLCAGHGSYTHHHVVLAKARTVTIDWDDYGLADPTRDVARFIVGLQRLALRSLGSMRALDGAADVFLKTYMSRIGPRTMADLPFYRAAICLRLAKKDVKRQAALWYEKAEATLDEGLRILDNPACDGGVTVEPCLHSTPPDRA
jgi:aminoglycoside phosphotransferase (APT) family kinase protein